MMFKLKNKALNVTEIERFEPNEKYGLSMEQVELRKSQNLINVIKNKNSKTYANIFISNTLTYFNLLCLLVFIALIIVHAPFPNLFFMFVIFCNALIGIIQEIKAKKAVEKLKFLSEPTATVLRGGEPHNIKVTQIVLDDIIEFSAGKQISADCIVLSGSVDVNESLLTGESDTITKKKGDTLFSGSFIVSGKCKARTDKIGNDSFVASLSAKAKKYKKPDSEIMRALRNMIKIIGLAIPLLAGLVFWNNSIFFKNDIHTFVVKTAGSIIGLIPAGLFLLSSVALAVGALRLAKRKCLVQDTHSIEMLARVNVLCLDKTGTITDGRMSVENVMPLQENLDLDNIVGNLLGALPDNNQTSIALKERFPTQSNFVVQKTYPFSSDKKMSAVTFEGCKTYAIGAPEFLLAKIDQKLSRKINGYAKQGLRVLLLSYTEKFDEKDFKKSMVPVALILLSDNIREDAISTIQWFRDNNVEVKVISGDNPITVASVSKRAGIANADKYISLEGLTEPEVVEAATNYTVFGRVTPDQKAVLIKTLKNNGKTVAMTGDGVNDILAMREADCSISIASGSDAARSISHIVLLDSDFSPMPMVVAEGRKIVNNLQRSSSLYLMKTFFIAMLCIFISIARIGYPLTTANMLLLEFGIIGFSSFILTLENNSKIIKGDFLGTIINNAVPAALVMIVNFIVLYIFDRFYDIEFNTLVVVSMTIVGILYLARLCIPYTFKRLCLVIGVSIFVAVGFIVFPATVGITNISKWSMYDILLISIASFVSFFLLKLLMYLSNKFKIRNPEINDL